MKIYLQIEYDAKNHGAVFELDTEAAGKVLAGHPFTIKTKRPFNENFEISFDDNGRGEMNEDLKESIETAGKELYTLDKYLKDPEMETLHGERFRKMIKALKTLITTTEQVLSTGAELPEKRIVNKVLDKLETQMAKEAYNEALDLCLPILAKYKMRVRELEGEIKQLKDKYAGCEGNCPY
jgi:hypothetical protein